MKRKSRMTTIFLTKTNCTNCGKQSTFERFDRVYAVKTPEIVSAILDWDFFKFTCHNCKDEPKTDYPVKFKAKPLVQKYEDPYKQAEYAYSLIESEV